MRNKFEDEFKKSMDTLRFSPEQKTHMAKNILQYQNQNEKREGAQCPADIGSASAEMKGRNKMNQWTLPKAAAVAAACLIVTGGSVFAGSKLVMYTSSSNRDYDYSSVTAINTAASAVNGKQDIVIPKFPETLGNYMFDGGNTVNVSGKDDAGNTLGKWDDLRAIYKSADGTSVNLLISANIPDDDRTPTETRIIDDIPVTYNFDEYLILPNENEPLAPEVLARKDNDEHFFVSYGSSEAETKYYRGLSFVKDGISYHIFSMDEVEAAELFKMAEELID